MTKEMTKELLEEARQAFDTWQEEEERLTRDFQNARKVNHDRYRAALNELQRKIHAEVD